MSCRTMGSVLLFICCMAITCASAYADLSPVGTYNACLVKLGTLLNPTNGTLTLADSGKAEFPAGSLSGQWTIADWKVSINWNGGGSCEGYIKDDVMALVPWDKNNRELLLAIRQNAKDAASPYTMSGAVYNPFSYNTLCVTNRDGLKLNLGSAQTYWCDEAVRFMLRLDPADGSGTVLRGYPFVEKSGAFHAGIEPPYGNGEKGRDLHGATAEDGSFFFASGSLAYPQKHSPVFTIGLKRFGSLGDIDAQSRFRFVSTDNGWFGATLILSNTNWSLSSGPITIGAGKVREMRDCVYVLQGDAGKFATATIDSTRRFVILLGAKDDSASFAIGFLEN